MKGYRGISLASETDVAEATGPTIINRAGIAMYKSSGIRNTATSRSCWGLNNSGGKNYALQN
jgi:hypothetical protein